MGTKLPAARLTLKEVLRGVIDAVPHVRNRARRYWVALAGTHADGSAKLTQAGLGGADDILLGFSNCAVRRWSLAKRP